MNSANARDERTLLVTGASRGIGKAISELLLEQGAWVIGIGRDFSEWPNRPPAFHPKRLDLSLIASLPEQLRDIATEFPAIDGLLCCAGSGRFGSLEEFSYQQIRDLLDLNLLQHIYVVRTFLPLLKRRRRGDIILIGSEAALAGGRRGAVYSAAKFAIRGFAQSLRQECASSGVRVCLINPGMVDTGFFDQLDFRPGTDEANALQASDIAEAAALALNARRGTLYEEINLSPLKKVIRFGPSS